MDCRRDGKGWNGGGGGVTISASVELESRDTRFAHREKFNFAEVWYEKAIRAGRWENLNLYLAVILFCFPFSFFFFFGAAKLELFPLLPIRDSSQSCICICGIFFYFFFRGNFFSPQKCFAEATTNITMKKKGKKREIKGKKKKKRCEVNLWIQIELIGKPERSRHPIDGGHVDTFGVRFFNWIYFSFYLRARARERQKMCGEKKDQE